jgi:hypothetical protein
VAAVPLLEDAELARHRPETAVALADCYVAVGELIRASDLYRAVAEEPRARAWTRADAKAAASARAKADAVEARVPTLAFEPIERYDDLEIDIDGRTLTSPRKPKRLLPDTSIVVEARARGRKPYEATLVLQEGEHRVLPLRLERVAPPPPKEAPPSETTLGVSFRGLVIPKWIMRAVGDGGVTMFVPGGAATLTSRLSDADFVISLGYASYRLSGMPFKANDTPVTEYEIVSSDLEALYGSVGLAWEIPLDDRGDIGVRLGGSVGVGWAFAGDLYRVQAYPGQGAGSDPYRFVACRGPNDPAGSYRYCNELDKDHDHYPGYVEPSWFEGGYRPLIYPWIAIPEVNLAWRVSPSTTLELGGGVTLSGLLFSLGGRVGL